LNVNVVASISSGASATGTEGESFNFVVQTSGVPTPAVTETGALPSGITFTDNGDGTAAIAGTPSAGSHGTYPITITADNGVDDPAVQNFTLTVLPGVGTSSATSSTNEGTSGTHTVNVAVVLTSPSASTVTVDWNTADGPGAHPADGTTDYTAASGIVTFSPGQTSKNVQVQVKGDTTVEYDETFSVVLSSPSNAGLGSQASTVVTITNDDSAKWVVSAPNTVEGNSGVTPVTVTISLTQPSAVPTTVDWATADGKAMATPARRDYIAASGSLTFAAGETSKTVSVDIRGDTFLEDTEYFRINLTNGSSGVPGGVTATGSGTENIVNDELPLVSMGNVSGIEGGVLVFKPQLKQRYYQNLAMCYATVDGTATVAAGDYTPTSSCFSVPAGVKGAGVVVVPALTDQTQEPAESFTLNAWIYLTPIGHTAKGTIFANNT
jgi:hypothetical protein